MQVYAPTTKAEEAKVEWLYKDLQDLLELTPEKEVLFIIRDWNAKLTSDTWSNGQIWPWRKNESEFCQENALVTANTLFQQHEKILYMDITIWSILKSDCLYSL